MKKFYKKLMLLGTVLTIGLSLAACGGNKEASTTTNQKEFVYVPEYQEMADGSDISTITISGNTIYYLTWSYDEATQTSVNAVKTMEIGGTESKTLPIVQDENSSISTISVDNEGNLVGILYSYTQGEKEEDYTQTYILKKYSPDGSEILSMDLTQMMSGVDSAYVQYLAIDGENNIYLSNGDSTIWVVDGSGNEVCTISVDSWINSMGTTKEGKVVVALYGENGIVMQDVDIAAKALGKTYENVPNSNGGFSILKGIEKGCLISTGNTLFSYDFDTQTSTEVLNWIDSDIDSNYILGMAVLEDGRLFAITREYNGDQTKSEMVYLTKKKSSEVAEKTILTYGSLYMSSNVRKAIIDFNKTNEKYRIQPKEYGTEDYTTGIAQLNSDIVSGKSPDIIDLSNGGTRQYMAKGVLEDLYPYMDKDSEVKKENYVQSALKAYEKDGKLYAVMPSFAVNTIIGKTSDVGSEMGWTIDDLIALVNSKPEGTQVFDYGTKESVLSTLCIFGMDQLVDWNTGECRFNGEDFIKMLDFANSFVSESEYTYDENEPSTPNKIRNGQLLLTMTSIDAVSSYQVYEEMYNEPITCIGYPTSEGSGSSMTSSDILIGISSKSKNKDGAWEFVRTFMTADYQTNNNSWGFPTLKSALEENFKQAMTDDTYDDGTGNMVKSTKMSWGFQDDTMIDVYAATQEQVDAVRNLIENANSVYEYNDSMYAIISEESAPFFAGQKTAKDVADVIQSRIQIYVNENR
ncbi:ABC transporter substrate-binding protein [Konateibacter massiliensis]|uniref:ABC transporter substrate-binding protein n=1 Tax=Konateibacter massiliensis TaxID=2002841 RepID=UPI0015D4DB5C|nr:extracellular solute-binding protein [Konateibacter massiliensis]